MYQYEQQNAGFGEYNEADVSADTQATAIKSVSRFAGFLARAFMSHRAAKRAAEGEAMEAESPCPDAMPGQAPGETPCARKAAELRARAAAWKARRRGGRP